MKNLGKKFYQMRRATVPILCAALLLTFFLQTDKQKVAAQESIATIPVGMNPLAVAVNPLTNKIYVANRQSNDVTVIDGANNSTTTIAAGVDPVAL
ncbi:MAG TPA: hypothetical protein VF599_15560, partial [Pyrinomonadaceae bacterium]